MNTFKINGIEYKAKPFDFNLVCDLEDMGITLNDMHGRNTSLIRAYFALCSGLSKEKAGKEIEQQFIKYGDLNEISEAMNKAMENSDFFHSLTERAEAATAENEETESKTEEQTTKR